jgi:hypothetical protein
MMMWICEDWLLGIRVLFCTQRPAAEADRCLISLVACSAVHSIVAVPDGQPDQHVLIAVW